MVIAGVDDNEGQLDGGFNAGKGCEVDKKKAQERRKTSKVNSEGVTPLPYKHICGRRNNTWFTSNGPIHITRRVTAEINCMDRSVRLYVRFRRPL